MGEGSAGVVWIAASGFRMLDIADDGVEVVVEVETEPGVVGCPACGVVAMSKDRRWVTLRDAPTAGRPVTVRWQKRIWQCREPACATKTWTEQRPAFARPRAVLTERAGRWATDRVEAVSATPASLGRELGVGRSTVWSAVERHGQERVDDPDRVGVTSQVGFDETVMSPAKRHRRRRFITAAVDVQDGQIIDIFDGRDRAELDRWLNGQPAEWLAGLEVISVDPHEGYRSAIVGSDLVGDVTVVVDAFHIVRLANAAVTKCRQRVQQDTLGHRGREGRPALRGTQAVSDGRRTPRRHRMGPAPCRTPRR